VLKSMTAFSRQEEVNEWGTIVWEIRSVNHRYLDLSIRIPEELRNIETKARDLLNASLSRGKVEASLRYKSGDLEGGEVVVNEALAQQLVSAAQSVQQLKYCAGPVWSDKPKGTSVHYKSRRLIYCRQPLQIILKPAVVKDQRRLPC